MAEFSFTAEQLWGLLWFEDFYYPFRLFLVISLLRFSIYSWFGVGGLCVWGVFSLCLVSQFVGGWLFYEPFYNHSISNVFSPTSAETLSLYSSVNCIIYSKCLVFMIVCFCFIYFSSNLYLLLLCINFKLFFFFPSSLKYIANILLSFLKYEFFLL